MALVTVAPFVPFLPIQATATNPTMTLDAADEVAGAVLQVRAGNVRYIHWHTATVTTGATVDVRVETINASGQPSSTLWATNTNGAQVVADANDNVWFRTQLTADATVADGDAIGVVIVNPSSSFATMNIDRGFQLYSANQRLPYNVSPDRTTKLGNVPCILIEYSDGTFLSVGDYIPVIRVSVNLNTGTNPDEVALYFTPTVPMRLSGWGMIAALAAGADYRIQLYAVGNNTPLLSTAYDGDLVQGTTIGVLTGRFTSSYTLVVGTAYRLALLPTTANTVTHSYGELPTAASMAAVTSVGGQLSTRNRSSTTDPDSASWTETTTRLPALWPLCDQMDDGKGLVSIVQNTLLVGVPFLPV